MIGPFRASRTVGGVGIPDQPNVFFVGVNNGGVWKTTDFGRTWNPIFDDAPTGSVGDIAVSPSNPDVIYVGSGEGLHRPDLGVGDGMFKSSDGGNTWSFIGLGDVQQVGRVIVDPENPDRVFVAGLGHPYGPNEQRGVFRTLDGGANWEKVLFLDQNTGAIQVEFDPSNSNVIYADLWDHREGPWENARFSGPNSALYKSLDGGNTWKKLETGLPSSEDGLGRIGIGISRSNPSIIYATVDANKDGGIYKSIDAGESWSLISTDRRIWGRGGDFGGIKVHPNNPDIVFAGNIASYKSVDGGKSWMSIKGAPGGDDYHRIWINPNSPDIMMFVADQGATITVNGGETWSSWYNQPTSQLYHVSTDKQFPYWVYGGQQESGAIGIASRGNGGQISFREFIGVGSDEYAYVAPDPKNPDIIFGGRVMKFNKKTGQSQNIAPEALRSGDYRILRTMPLLFHPADDDMLLFATNVLWKSMDRGNSWEIISPDLSFEQPTVPESIGDYRTSKMGKMNRRGVIYALSPSPMDVNVIWAGTDDGRVHVTKNGGQKWEDVTPAELSSWDKISQIDAGHFDKEEAFIAVNAIRKDDMRPLIFRTKDGGQTWTKITKGMNPKGPVNTIREDIKRKGLLFAGTEREVYFSLDAGENWKSLRQNMPATSIRDLVIKDNDLVIGTHGRSIWILDDISPLRQAVVNESKTKLYAPAEAIRVRWNMFLDTPLPPEEPAGENPPEGGIIDYYLADDVEEVRIEIFNEADNLVRTYWSNAPLQEIDTNSLPHPTYWMKPEQKIETSKGHHRIYWDLRYDPPRGSRRQFSIAAVKGRTPSGPIGPFVAPGVYQIRFNAGTFSSEQSMVVRLDPRVDIADEDLALQTNFSLKCYEGYHLIQELVKKIDELSKPSKELQNLRGDGSPGLPDILYGSIYKAQQETLVGLQKKYLHLIEMLQSADARPTVQLLNAVQDLEKQSSTIIDRTNELLK